MLVLKIVSRLESIKSSKIDEYIINHKPIYVADTSHMIKVRGHYGKKRI